MGPVRFGPDGDIGLAFEECAEGLGRFRVAHELLQAFEIVPGIHCKKIHGALRVQVSPVTCGSHGTGHLGSLFDRRIVGFLGGFLIGTFEFGSY